MKHLNLICLSFLLFSAQTLVAQSDWEGEEKKIMQPIIQLFDGMRKGDSAMVRSVFTEEPELYSVGKDKAGNAMIKQGNLEEFLTSIGTPHDEVYDEPIWNTKINIDGDLASVWTDYAFFLGSDFSHCGVDAFHLFKEDGEWKIFQLTDTRRKEGCEEARTKKTKG